LEQKSRVVDVFREIPYLESFCSCDSVAKDARILERHLAGLMGPGFFHPRSVLERPRKAGPQRRTRERLSNRSEKRRGKGQRRFSEDSITRLDQEQSRFAGSD